MTLYQGQLPFIQQGPQDCRSGCIAALPSRCDCIAAAVILVGVHLPQHHVVHLMGVCPGRPHRQGPQEGFKTAHTSLS